MSEHRLTVVVPTYNRPHLLPRALESLKAQLEPVNVIVADDGDKENHEKTARILDEHFPSAEHIITENTGEAWPNWRTGAGAAKSEFVSWLQDDDEVTPIYAKRIVSAFDRHKDANVWMSRLHICIGDRMGLWNCGAGPIVPMDMIGGQTYSWAEGSVLTSTMYFTSWSLSPSVAFRNNAAFRLACDAIPEHCDIHLERLLLAFVSNGGPFISDPVLAGYWHQHDDHLSTKQHPDQPSMTKIMIRELDRLLDHMQLSPRGMSWQESLIAWAQLVPTSIVLSWVGQIDHTLNEGGPSKHARTVQKCLVESLKGRVKLVSKPRQWWRSAVHWVANRVAF